MGVVSQRQPQVWLGKELDEDGVPKGASVLIEAWQSDLESDESFGGVAARHSLQLVEGALLVFQGVRPWPWTWGNSRSTSSPNSLKCRTAKD